jgi:hypothetical protein
MLGPVGTQSDRPPPMARIARSEWERWPAERIRTVRTPAVYWTGSGWEPAWVVAWIKVYNEWYVRLRTRRDVWRDEEAWYCYRARCVLPVELDERDRPGWLPER